MPRGSTWISMLDDELSWDVLTDEELATFPGVDWAANEDEAVGRMGT